MQTFLAYFDFLGYKNFIENNTDERIVTRVGHIQRNMEMALSGGKIRESIRRPGMLLYDITESPLNCLNFSDTVLFWTNDCEHQDFLDIMSACYTYNSFGVRLDFPSRGCLVYGDIRFSDFDQKTSKGGRYMTNMIYGRALIDAHLKAENLDWAGCVLDDSAKKRALELGIQQEYLDEHLVKYNVPYKNGANINEYALRLLKGGNFNDEQIKNMTTAISRAFTGDNKGEIVGRVKEIYDNTIAFLHHH